MKVKFNHNHNYDNKSYAAGEVADLSEAQYNTLKEVDIFGMPLIGADQTPLISDAGGDTKPKVKEPVNP